MWKLWKNSVVIIKLTNIGESLVECVPGVYADGATSYAAGRTLGSILSSAPRFKIDYVIYVHTIAYTNIHI